MSSEPNIKYQGDLQVSQLVTTDRVHAHDFLKFKELGFHSLAVGYNPLFVNIKEISLRDFFAKIVINNDGGSTNVQDILGALKKETNKREALPDEQPFKEVQSAKPAESPQDIKIGRVSFHGGTVEFADHNIKPNYAATMLNLKGSVTGLSSQDISRAKVDLKGNLRYGSAIAIAGTINPLIKDSFADIKVSFKEIEMGPVTPYSIRYFGYPITKGKLTFNVAYLIR